MPNFHSSLLRVACEVKSKDLVKYDIIKDFLFTVLYKYVEILSKDQKGTVSYHWIHLNSSQF